TYWLTAQQAGAFEELRMGLGQVFTLPKDMVMELEDIEEEDMDMFLAFTPQGTVTAGICLETKWLKRGTIRLVLRSSSCSLRWC
ncbi:MAG: hypothetical protein ACYSUD_14115, partial [Planctomycetota bacterium]